MQRSASLLSSKALRSASACHAATWKPFSRSASSLHRAIATQQTQQESSSSWAWRSAVLGGGALAAGFAWHQQDQFFARSEQPEHQKFPYVLIGAGPAVLSAAEMIRDSDPDSEILILGEYRAMPYTRKALLNVILEREEELLTIDRQPEEWFEEMKIKYYPGVSIYNIDATNQAIFINGNRVISYDQCLIASGSRPRLPGFKIDEKAPASLFYTLEDAEKLRDVLQQENKTVAVIGSSSWACTLSSLIATRFPKKGVKVQQIFGEDGILPEILPPYLSRFAHEKHTTSRENLTVRSQSDVARIGSNEDGSKALIELTNGEVVEVDHAVVVSPLLPNMSFSGPLEVDNRGFVANRELQVASNLYAAGEAASHYDPGYGRRTLWGENNEILSGSTAGSNMVKDRNIPYESNIVEEYKVAGNRFNVIGRCDPSLRTYSVWLRPMAEYENEEYSSEEYQKGIVYYLLPDDRLTGVLLWNMPDEEGLKEDRAISVIKSRRPFDGDTVQSAITIADKDYFVD